MKRCFFTMWTAALAVVLTVLATVAGEATAETPAAAGTTAAVQAEKPGTIDLSPWAYEWRADRQVQAKPEACFVPQRLERLDKIYRDPVVKEKMSKFLRTRATEPLPTLAPPKGRLCAALLWLGPSEFQRVELQWPADGAEPPPDAVEVRTYPGQYGWFGLVADAAMEPPKVSEDRRLWEYRPRSNPRHERFADMVAVFIDESKLRPGAKPGVPRIRLFRTETWKRMDLEIEWGLEPTTAKAEFDGNLESWVGVVGKLEPLSRDKGTTLTEDRGWRSRHAADSARRGVALSLDYAPRPPLGATSFKSSLGPGKLSPLDTRLTLRTKSGNFTFLPSELDFTKAIIVPELGFVVMRAGSGKTGRQWMEEWAAKNPKCLPEMTREHPEIASWEELMRRVRFDPALTSLPPLQPFPEEVPATAMRVQLPDERWNDAWRRSFWELSTGKGGYDWLAFEAARSIQVTDLLGFHQTSGQRLEYWLKAPGRKPEGGYVDGEGALEYAKDVANDIAWGFDGIHPCTGGLLSTLADRYLLSGDKEWFLKNRPRMQAAADWIVRQRRSYLQDVPNRETLEAFGLHPPHALGDHDWGACLWRWFPIQDAFSLIGLRRFADALAEFDSPTAEKYRAEAQAYAADLRRAMDREIDLSPVRPAQTAHITSIYPPVSIPVER